MAGDDHPSAERVAAFLDGTLDGPGRRVVERHLAECAECRAERDALVVQLRTAPRRRRLLPLPAIIGSAAAAALLFTVLLGRVEAPVVRTQQPARTEGLARVTVVAPVAGSLVTQESLVLSWRAFSPAADYYATVLDSVGIVLWSTRTVDTTATLPAGLLKPGTAFWHVDALRADGISATSGMIELRIR